MWRHNTEPDVDGTNNLAGSSGPPHDRGMEARVAVLEEIAAATQQVVVELRSDNNRRFDEVSRRFDDVNRRFDAMRDAMERDFRILFGALITVALGLAALMARGFHWF